MTEERTAPLSTGLPIIGPWAAAADAPNGRKFEAAARSSGGGGIGGAAGLIGGGLLGAALGAGGGLLAGGDGNDVTALAALGGAGGGLAGALGGGLYGSRAALHSLYNPHPGEEDPHHEGAVPLAAMLPYVGPAASVVTAPEGRRFEALSRQTGGAGLGGAAGGLAGAALGAGLGGVTGDPDAALMGAQALGGLGALGGGIYGSYRALRSMYPADSRGRTVTASVDPYDIELLKLADAAMRIP